MDSAELAQALEHRSGLLGLAGSAEMADVVARAEKDEQDAALALGVYAHRLRGSIAAMAAGLGGVDVLAFTGGVGERSPVVRRLAAEGLAFLGIELGPDQDVTPGEGEDREIGAPGAAVRTVVLRAREDVVMGRQARAALARA